MNIWDLEACPLQRGDFYCVLLSEGPYSLVCIYNNVA